MSPLTACNNWINHHRHHHPLLLQLLLLLIHFSSFFVQYPPLMPNYCCYYYYYYYYYYPRDLPWMMAGKGSVNAVHNTNDDMMMTGHEGGSRRKGQGDDMRYSSRISMAKPLLLVLVLLLLLLACWWPFLFNTV